MLHHNKNKTLRLFTFLVVVLLQAFFVQNAIAQNPDKKISVSFRNATFTEALNDIQAKSGMLFSFPSDIFGTPGNINYKARNVTVTVVLDNILKNSGIEYKLVEKQIVLIKKAPSQIAVPQQFIQKKKFTLSGHIREKNSGELIIGANVFDKLTYKGTLSNAYGFYSLQLPEGSYLLQYSYLGYKAVQKQIVLQSNVQLDVELENAGLELNTVEITSGELNQSASPEIRISGNSIDNLTTFAGNFDMIKTLQSMPGIKGFGDGSTLLYVRGGNSDQNLLLIDEAPVYNASHLFGFFSVMAPDAIKDVQVYKGDIPASAGGRLSSVIDIRAKDGNMMDHSLSGNIGPFASSLTAQGPLIKEKASYITSFRASNLNWLLYVLNGNRDVKMNFYDFNAKVNAMLSKNDRLYLTFFTGSDELSRKTNTGIETSGIGWNNMAFTVRENHVFSPKLFSNTTFYYSKYAYKLYMNEEKDIYWMSAIRNMALKTDFTWYLNSNNTIKAGVEAAMHHFDPGNVHIAAASDDLPPEVSQYHSPEYTVYLQNEQQIGKKLNLRYGLRYSVWQNMGESDIYYFDVSHHVIDTVHFGRNEIYSTFATYPEPRFQATYCITGNARIKAGYSRTVQYMQVISNSTSPFTTLDVWIPAGPNIEPMSADQFSGGMEYFMNQLNLDFTADAYYKKMKGQTDYGDHPNLLYNPLIEGEIRPGTAEAWGFEGMVRRNKGLFTGWIGYSYAKTTKAISEVNHNLSFPAAYDRPHNIVLNLSYALGAGWIFAADWIYMTGAAVTTPIAFYRYNGYMVPVYGSRHNSRLSDYHRLDVTVKYHLNSRSAKFSHELVLSLYNVYNRKNPVSVNFNKTISGEGEIVVPGDVDNYTLFYPSITWVSGIIPSVNYIFKF
jgi:hypothetical protein